MGGGYKRGYLIIIHIFKLQLKSTINLKAQEFSNYLSGKNKAIDFTKPILKLDRIDSQDLRDKILNPSYVEWEKMGFSKGTLYYMKQNAKGKKPFTLNSHVKEKLESIG